MQEKRVELRVQLANVSFEFRLHAVHVGFELHLHAVHVSFQLPHVSVKNLELPVSETLRTPQLSEHTLPIQIKKTQDRDKEEKDGRNKK